MLRFYAPHTPRLEYTLNFVFAERLGIPYVLVDSDDALSKHSKGCLITYMDDSTEGVQIIPEQLLSEKSIPIFKKIYLDPFKDYIVNPFSFPDIFSAIFYHLSRAEEYNSPADLHGRFSYKNSCLFNTGKPGLPLIDLWILQFRNFLIRYHNYNESEFKSEPFTFKPTLDIDSVYAYKGRGFLRQSGALIQNLLGGNFHEFLNRLKVLSGRNEDPNDNFGLQFEILKDIKAQYFFQVGPYGKYDKNISLSNPGFRKIVQQIISQGHRPGLHPSYNSFGNPAQIRKEKTRLEELCGTEIVNSRQHFLRFRMPSTYRELTEAGIQNDFSMGYSETIGYRAATANSFIWFDLEMDAPGKLRIYPFAVMDVALKQFMELNPDESVAKSSVLLNLCKEMNLPFVSVFHNESLSGHRGWEKWEKVFRFWIHG